MKKLIIAVAAIASAVAVNAATVNWASGTLRGAANADGGWGTASIANASKDPTSGTAWYMAVYLVDATTYNSLTTQESIWKYTGAKKVSDLAGTDTATYKSVTKTSGNAASASTDASVGTTYYAAVIAGYHDVALDKDFYLASRATIDGATIDNAGNTYSVSGILTNVGTTAASAGGGWQVVPEPTSGLLMLLGMAGLALRRRRA